MVTRLPRATAVSRAADALEVVATLGAASLTEIADRSGLAISSASDLVNTLLAGDLLRRDEAGDYALASGIAEVASSLAPDYGLTDTFAGLAGRTRALEGLTVSLDVLVGGLTLCLDVRLGSGPLATTPRAGLSAPIGDSAAGRAIVRSMSPADLQEHIRQFRGQRGLEARSIDEFLAVHKAEYEQVSVRFADLTVSWPTPTGDIDYAHPVVRRGDSGARATVVVRLGSSSTTSERRRAERGVRSLAEMLTA